MTKIVYRSAVGHTTDWINILIKQESNIVCNEWHEIKSVEDVNKFLCVATDRQQYYTIGQGSINTNEEI